MLTISSFEDVYQILTGFQSNLSEHFLQEFLQNHITDYDRILWLVYGDVMWHEEPHPILIYYQPDDWRSPLNTHLYLHHQYEGNVHALKSMLGSDISQSTLFACLGAHTLLQV